MMDAYSEEFYNSRREDLKERVSKKRLAHIDGVVETAIELARAYGVDERAAALAGLLHDWDKGLNDDEARSRAHDLGIVDEVGQWVVDNMPPVLHGPTAAKALHQQFPEIPCEVIEAVRKHTTASTNMSDLDKIIYVADAIEPSREFDKVKYLRSLIGEVSLDELYFRVYKFWTLALIEHNVVLHPDTISIWNNLVHDKKKRQ